MANNTGMPQGLKTILGWALGIGVIALVLLILAILFGNLAGNVGFTTESETFVNQTIELGVNATPTAGEGRVNGVFSDLFVQNASGFTVATGNITIDGITIRNATASHGDEFVNVTGTITFDSQGKIDADNIITNYTKSAVNISAQFPVVGTIIGVALLLVILIGVLIFAISKMLRVADTGATSGGSPGTGESKSFDRGGMA